MTPDKRPTTLDTLRWLASIGVPEEYMGFRLDEFDRGTPSQARALELVLEYSENAYNNLKAGRGLFLTGDEGVGKTHLAVGLLLAMRTRIYEALVGMYMDRVELAKKQGATVDRYGFMSKDGGITACSPPVLENCFNARFVSSLQHMKSVKASFSSRSRLTTHDTGLEGCDFLVLDDFGKERVSSYVAEYLYALLDYRYIKQLPTVITTNANLKAIKEKYNEVDHMCFKLGSCLASRIQEKNILIHIKAPDGRKRPGAAS